MSERLFLRLDEDALQGPESSAPAGTLQAFAIPAPLRPYVSHLLLCRELLPEGVEIEERVLPDGAQRLVLNLGDAPSEGPEPGLQALALGASAAPALVRMRGRVEGFSLALRPGAAAALFGMPASELAGAALSLEELWGRDATALLERLAAARDDVARVELIGQMLQRRLRSERAGHAGAAARAAALIAASGGGRSLREVADELGLGERRLQQLFQLHIGLPPRTWGRLVRMHRVLRALRRLQDPAWAALAVEHGYYDQAHLANEFRSLCGLSPTEYLQRTISPSSKPPR